MILRKMLVLLSISVIQPCQKVFAAPEAGTSAVNDVRWTGAKDMIKVKQIPAFVKQLMPSKAKSVFCGLASIPESARSKSNVLVHLYRVEDTSDSRSSRGLWLTSIDIFYRPTGRGQYRRIGSFDKSDPELKPLHDIPLLFAQWSWVEPKSHQTPLIRLCCYTYEGFYGSFGENIFLAFPTGIGRKPTVQVFPDTADHIEVSGWDFGAIDENGRRYFLNGASTVGDPYQRVVETKWLWNPETSRFRKPTSIDEAEVESDK